MRSEELAVLAGDIRPVDLGPLHNRAREEVVSKGKATGADAAVKTGEAAAGIERLWPRRAEFPELATYLGAIAALNPAAV